MTDNLVWRRTKGMPIDDAPQQARSVRTCENLEEFARRGSR